MTGIQLDGMRMHQASTTVRNTNSCRMKGTKVQTLGARAVAGAWCMAGRLIILGNNYYDHGCNYACAPLIDGLGLATQTVLATSHRLAM